MTNRELAQICTDLQVAKNWNQNSVTVFTKSPKTGIKMTVVVPVTRLSDYQKFYKTESHEIQI